MPIGEGGVCPALLIDLAQVDKINDPQMKRPTPLGFLEMLNSPLNDPSIEVKGYDQKNGHRVDVRVKYLKRRTEADVSETKDYCASGVEDPYFEENVVVDSYVQDTIKLTNDTLQTYCSSAGNLASLNGMPMNRELLKRVMMTMNALREKLNRKLLTIMSTNFSAKPNSGAGATNVRLLGSYSSGSQFNNAPGLDGVNEILHQYSTAALSGTPIAVGNGNLDRWVRGMGWGCCNEVGYDLTKATGLFNFFKDIQFPNVVGGADRFGFFAPGTVQMVGFVENRAPSLYFKKVGDVEYGVLPDPLIPGLEWDIQVRWDCDKFWLVTISTNAGLFVEPSDVFAYGDIQNATNYGNTAIRGAWLYNGVGN